MGLGIFELLRWGYQFSNNIKRYPYYLSSVIDNTFWL